MIARVWHGRVPLGRADEYERYLTDSERGVPDYERIPGNRGADLMRRDDGDVVHFMLTSFWDSRAAIEAYAGPEINRAQYFPFDLECLLDPDPHVTHYEVLVASKK